MLEAGTETSRDGGGDAPVDTGPDVYRCSNAFDFCDDFEGTRPLQGQWSGVGVAGTGSLAIEAGVLRGQLGTGPSVAGHYAALSRTAPWPGGDGGARRRARATFRANVITCSVPTPVTIATVAYEGVLVDVWTWAESTGVCTARITEIVSFDGGAAYNSSPTIVLSTNTWHDYVLDLQETPAGIGGLTTLTVDTETVSLTLTGRPTPANLTHQFGTAQGTLAGTNALVYLDDYRFDYLK